MIFDEYTTGARLRNIRLFYNQTQKQMAGLFGVKRGTYSAWESRYKRKTLPKYVIDKLWDVTLILRKPYIITYKKESIWKRILKWIMRKN